MYFFSIFIVYNSTQKVTEIVIKLDSYKITKLYNQYGIQSVYFTSRN